MHNTKEKTRVFILLSGGLASLSLAAYFATNSVLNSNTEKITPISGYEIKINSDSSGTLTVNMDVSHTHEMIEQVNISGTSRKIKPKSSNAFVVGTSATSEKAALE